MKLLFPAFLGNRRIHPNITNNKKIGPKTDACEKGIKKGFFFIEEYTSVIYKCVYIYMYEGRQNVLLYNVVFSL